MTTPLALTREQILAFRRRAGALDERLPFAPESLRRAAWAGLQDSMPRAALLSIHARVKGAHPSSWEDPSLVQVWGPRWSVYVVAAHDRAFFTLGRLHNLQDNPAFLADPYSTKDKVNVVTIQRTAAVSDSIFGAYVVPFEVASVLLLAALVGAVALARRD